MKTIKYISCMFAISAALLLSSCLKGSESNMAVNTDFPNLFNAVVDKYTGDITLYPGQAILVKWNYIDGANSTASVQLTGFKIPNGMSYTNLTFSDVPWKFNNRGWMDISFTNKTPDGASGLVSNLIFENFNLQTINRQWNKLTFPPCLKAQYDVNGQYTVYALPVEFIEVGDMVVTSPDGSTFKLTGEQSPIYYFELDPATKKAFIVIQGAKFADKMPAMNMKFPDITMDVNQVGIITLTADSLTPALLEGTTNINDKGTPMEAFPITDVRAELNAARGVVVSFKCLAMGTLYNVSFTCNYPETTTPSTPTTQN